MSIENQYYSFPPEVDLPDFLREIKDVFVDHEEDIDSCKDDSKGKRKSSNEVLKIITLDPSKLQGWCIEKGKKRNEKNELPTFDGNGVKSEMKKNPDGWHIKHKAILEVEGPRAWVANAWSRDIVKTMQTKQDYLVLAVRRLYRGSNDYMKIQRELKVLPEKYHLKGILLIGY